MSKTNTPKNEKEFSLKPIELQMIQNMHERANSQLFDYLSFVAIERLAYTPVKGTQFRIEDGKLFISEAAAEEEVTTA